MVTAILLLCVLNVPVVHASRQMIPASRRVTWIAGVPGGIPEVPVMANVRDFGAKGDGVSDDSLAFQNAINSINAGAVFIPAGTYLLRAALYIHKSVVLRGESASKTVLLINHTFPRQPAIAIATYNFGEWINVTGGYSKNSTTLTLVNPAPFKPGGFVELSEDNDPQVMYTKPDWDIFWAQESVGQLFKVVSVSGNIITIDPALSLNYQAKLRPRVRTLDVVQYAGIERLHLKRLDRGDSQLILLQSTAYSWVRDVESEYAFKAHIQVANSYRCEIRDSYFHDAGNYGGGGHGYGVEFDFHTSNCLVENNIFKHLRHAMLIQLGSNSNVFDYNYALDGFWDQAETPPDISVHGHYPYSNLFEGNIVQKIGIADFWGPAGPWNTYFRNLVYSENINVWDYSHEQNIVGNDVTQGYINIDKTATGTLIHGNRVHDHVVWNNTIHDLTLPASFYYDSKPAFYGSMNWPSVGSDILVGTNPAKERYDSGDFVPTTQGNTTVSAKIVIKELNSSIATLPTIRTTQNQESTVQTIINFPFIWMIGVAILVIVCLSVIRPLMKKRP
jgi:hypothetical protein